MTTALGVLITVFVLLPGFLLLRFRQATAEHRDLGTFEISTVSVAYSVIIFSGWFITNLGLQGITQRRYSFLEQLASMAMSSDIRPFLSKATAAMVIVYVGVFLASGLLVYNIAYIGAWFRFLQGIGVTRFSRHLTPWEDFLTLNHMNWIAVEMTSGKTYVGRIGLFSHQPFERNELVLTGTSESPVIVYDTNNKMIDFGPCIHQVYVAANEIRAMHAIPDASNAPSTPRVLQKFSTVGSLTAAICALIVLVSAIAANITQALPHAPILDFIGGCFTLGFILLNLLSLKPYR